MSVKQHIQSIAIGAALFTLGALGCGGSGGGTDTGPLSNVDSLIILQRAKPNVGNVFDYNAYKPGARLIQLKPPTANGTVIPICCKQDRDFADVDIADYDISFDAKTIVFSARRGNDPSFGLYLLELSDGKITQIATDPMRDFVSPIFLPGDKILFTTNAVVEAGARQHEDEYERATTSQLGRVNVDGTELELGARNLSHRRTPSLASDGRVIFTQWDHLGETNEANLMFVNQDMEELREGFGKEGTGAANSYLKALEVSTGRFVAIATARDRTVQAGALIDIRLGTVANQDGVVSAPTNQSEAHATFRSLTPDVPMGNDPSANTIGRYYDAYPLNAKDKPDLLVSWADGPVESEFLAQAGLSANFGVYLLDTEHQQRRPILDDPDMWDIFPRPLQTRSAPVVVSSAHDPRHADSVLIGSLDVYDSSLHTFNRPAVGQPGEIYGVRAMEGFSSEEGPTMFGTTMFEGHANLGVAPISADNKSWSALIPANIPVHLQAVDVFGMSLFNEPVWISGRPGEARMCGGCHEDRTKTTNVAPGLLDTFAVGATDLMSKVTRGNRINTAVTSATPTDIVGVGWDTQVQPIFEDNCVGCHNATTNTNLGHYVIQDATGKQIAEWHLDLSATKVPPELAVVAGGGAFTASYFSMAGPDEEAIERNHLKVVGTLVKYMKPLDALHSPVIQKLNPTQLFPAPGAKRAFPVASNPPHLTALGKPDLSSRQFYMLILAADMGVNFYARENKSATTTP
jgi:hydrazine synthase alpha subunit-like protein